MRLHLGWGDLATDAEAWVAARATARVAELHGPPNGLRRERHQVELDAVDHAAARRRLLALEWFPPGLLRAARASDGRTVLQRCRFAPPFTVDAPVRVAEWIEEPHRLVVTMVTLAGHPERGVERYELVLDPALGRASLAVDKAWELAEPLARLAAPFSAWLQGHATRASLRHLAASDLSERWPGPAPGRRGGAGRRRSAPGRR